MKSMMFAYNIILMKVSFFIFIKKNVYNFKKMLYNIYEVVLPFATSLQFHMS